METSNESTGETLFDLTLFAGDTLASRSAQRGNATGQTIRDTCGLGFETPLANYDPDMRCWKMFGDISLWGEPRLLGNLPPSGMTRSGVLFLQPLWVPITDATGSSLWPTPTAHSDNSNANGKFPNDTLRDAVMRATWPTPTGDDASNVNPKPNRFRGLVAAVNETMTWPTPTAADAWTDSLESSQIKPGSMHSVTLGRAVQMWPTMSANGMGNTGSQQIIQRQVEAGKVTEDEKRSMTAGNGGKLNPTWVEWLMGFPIGWTDLED